MAVKLIINNGGESSQETFLPELSDITDVVADTLIKTNVDTLVQEEITTQLQELNFDDILATGTTVSVETVSDDATTDAEILASIAIERNGDIVIIKRLLDAAKYSHTAYIAKDEHWEALDGNYDATNVYFSTNLKITRAFGKYIPEANSNLELPLQGKSIFEVYQDAFSEATPPGVTLPSLSVTWKNFTAKEVGTPISTSSKVVIGTLTANVGAYTAPNQASGVTFNNIAVDAYLAGNPSYSSMVLQKTNVSTTSSFDLVWDFSSGSMPTFDSEGVPFDCNYWGDYSNGAEPVDNLGNKCPDRQITSSNCGTYESPLQSSTDTNRFKGFRNYWYGYVPTAYDKDNVITRNSSNNKVFFNGSELTAAGQAAAKGYVKGCNASTGLNSGTDNKAFVVLVPTAAKLKLSGGTSFGVTKVIMDETYFKKITDASLEIPGYNDFEAVQYDILMYKPQSISNMTISYTLGEDK